MKKYTHVIWDFNGTILDDVAVGISSINALLSRRGLPVIGSVAQYQRLFGFPIREYYRRCGLPIEEYETVLAPEWVAEYRKREKSAGLCRGVTEALSLFSGMGLCQTVISASEKNLLHEQLSRLGVLPYFSGILCNDDIYANGKTALYRYFKEQTPDAVPLVIGDTTHDAEAASAVSFDCALVLTGHMDRQALTETGFPVYEDAGEVARLLFSGRKRG